MTENFHVQRESLRSCGKEFHSTAVRFAAIASRIGDLGVSRELFTGPGSEIATAYEEFRSRMYDIAAACVAVLDGVDSALHSVADNYQTVEDDIQDALGRGLSTS